MLQNLHDRVSRGSIQSALNIGQAEERCYQHTKSQAAIDEDAEHDSAGHNDRGILNFLRHLESSQSASSSESMWERIVVHGLPHLRLFPLSGIPPNGLTKWKSYVPVKQRTDPIIPIMNERPCVDQPFVSRKVLKTSEAS